MIAALLVLLAWIGTNVCAADGSGTELWNEDGTLVCGAPFSVDNLTASTLASNSVAATHMTTQDVSTHTLSASTLTIDGMVLDEDTLRALLARTVSSSTCGKRNCSEHAVCEDGKRCVCLPGYRGSGTTCDVINPCADDTHGCVRDGSVVCALKAVATYVCSCAPGYAPMSIHSDTCVPNAVQSDGSVHRVHEISDNTYLLHSSLDINGFFGSSVANIGDLNGEYVSLYADVFFLWVMSFAGCGGYVRL